jgi:hypothetical protein
MKLVQIMKKKDKMDGKSRKSTILGFLRKIWNNMNKGQVIKKKAKIYGFFYKNIQKLRQGRKY